MFSDHFLKENLKLLQIIKKFCNLQFVDAQIYAQSSKKNLTEFSRFQRFFSFSLKFIFKWCCSWFFLILA